jgi:hypothetical protein
MVDGGWQMADGGWWMANGKDCVEGQKCYVAVRTGGRIVDSETCCGIRQGNPCTLI